MFKNLTDFSHKRSGKEAFGFYLAYLVLIMLLGGLLGGIMGLVMGGGSFELGLRLGNLTAVLVVLGLSFAVLAKKNLMGNFGMILVAVVSGLLAFLGGGLLGLIPTAYLTTK